VHLDDPARERVAEPDAARRVTGDQLTEARGVA
jgi:hypothetical protein